jgi:hypothetical protein
MNADFLTALKSYIEDQHITEPGPYTPLPPRYCAQCGSLHHTSCSVGNLLKQIDIALVKAVRKEVSGG